MSAARRTELLGAAAAALEQGQSPLEHAFLAEHEVTLEEAYSLADLLAIGARLVAHAIEHPREASAAVNAAGLIAGYAAISKVGGQA